MQVGISTHIIETTLSTFRILTVVQEHFQTNLTCAMIEDKCTIYHDIKIRQAGL